MNRFINPVICYASPTGMQVRCVGWEQKLCQALSALLLNIFNLNLSYPELIEVALNFTEFTTNFGVVHKVCNAESTVSDFFQTTQSGHYILIIA